MIKILIFLITLYLGLCAAMYLLQRKLLYMPNKTISAPADYGLSGFNELTAMSEDGERLQLWHRPAQIGLPTILYFHGNAANIANRAPTYAAFADKGFGVLALSYRGYGKSTGFPSEDGLYKDGRAALALLVGELGVPLSNVILYGESLGSGVAVQMALEHTPAATVLEAPYTSVANRAAEIYYYVPVHLLIKDHFNSVKKMPSVKSPLLILHGARDIVIPIAHGKALFEAANEPKKAVFFDHIGHNDFDREVISEHVLAFAKEHGLVAP